MQLDPGVEMLVTGASWLLMLVLIAVSLTCLYRVAPTEPNGPETSPGSLVACIVWLIASIGFAIYVSNLGSCNERLGSLVGVIVLLMWLWISVFIVFMEAELNAEMEVQTRHDSTIGADEPMGERGAEKADRLGESKG